jgi:phenylpropionate dioxygenase-like ring-hydroxylating dioxygenase large terminal subunit
MLCTKQKVLRRFWYATLPVDKLDDGPKPFTLLGEKIVLFLDGQGNPAALADRCCHRTAKLSKGWSRDGYITCGYHGWTYDRAGKLVRIPQFAPEQPLPDARVKAFHCDTRYGYVWVALEEPLLPIPDLPQDRDPSYRRIHQFDDRWNTAALRMMENSFDNAHFSFVHKSTFGQLSQPKPEKYELVETDYGFRAETIVPINNPPAAFRVTGTTEPTTKRHMRNAWFMPFCRTLDIEYPTRAAAHHFQLGDPDRRWQHPARASAVPQRSGRRLLHAGTDRLGCRDHRRGSRDSGVDRPRCHRRRQSQDRDAHAVGPARHADAQASARAA